MILELTADEVEMLDWLLESQIRTLGPEIHHTDTRAFRAMLENFRQKLERLRERLMQLEMAVAK
jgi:hypothetical protein